MSEKYYTLGTHTSEQWAELHAELIADGNVYESVPARQVTIVDDKLHSPTRGSYLLTKEEVNDLRNDERVKFINLSPEKYPDVFEVDPEELICVTNNTLTDRWSNAYNNYQEWAGSLNFNANEPTINRTSALYRMQTKQNPWKTSSTDENVAISAKLQQVGSGENVDIICADNGTWIGHPEFINSGVTGSVNPTDYVGGNVLPGNGYCDVLDLVLDAPYYIDPDWFNADASNRLMTRWDGTTVPVESVARNWWRNSSQRSTEFAAFGNIPVRTTYTRDRAHGSNTVSPHTQDISTTPGVPVVRGNGTHGTQCASLIYGRTHGWAYNANKWHLNLLGYYSVGSFEIGFDVQKVFHQYKPVNPLYNTKDPTMSSNSWGLRASKSGTHYYFRNSGAVAYGGESDEPEFIDWLGATGDSGRWKSEIYDNSMTVAGDELIESGIIFVVAAGNSNQQQVNPDHPNYDNRISNNNTNTFYQDDFDELAGYESTGSTNRRGFPQHIGKTESQTFQGNTTVKFPAINIGALDDNMVGDFTQDQKVSYSDSGPAIDLFAPGDGTLAASRIIYQNLILDGDLFYNRLGYTRVDNTYSGLSAVERYNYRGPAASNRTIGEDGQAMLGETEFNRTYSTATDTKFTGTSSACPVACGFLAIVMQYNRGWDYEDLRSWIQNNVQTQPTADMYEGTELTTATANWAGDYNALNGAERRILYQATIPVSTAFPTSAPADALGPVITIIGDNPATVELGATYTDAGATAVDAVDGSVSVTSSGTVDTSTVGAYTITYTATDAASNTTTSTRTVNVVDTTAPIINSSNIVSSVNEGITSLGTVSANETVTWSISGSGVSISTSGVVTLDSPADYETATSHSFVITATDDSGNTSSTSSITVSVVDSDDDGSGDTYDGPLVINVILGTTVSTATEEAGDAFFGGNTDSGEVINRLPPVYANDGYSVSISFEALGAASETWTVDSITATSNTNFNYSLSSPQATITQQNDPYSTDWTCLMEDYSTQIFPSEIDAAAASDPALLELISLTIPDPIVNEETHTFTVNVSEAGGTTESRSVDIDQAKHFDAQSFISKVSSIT
jgi:hypothetical protein